MISVLINGISGRMGHAIYAACNASRDAFLALCGVDKFPADAAIACPVYADYSEIQEQPDIVIDFSIPAAMPPALQFALARGIPFIVGTTGLSENEHMLLKSAAEHIPVFQTGNMSLGVNLQLALTKLATAALHPNFDAEIIEKHHNLKIDAPSGTALMLADAIASQRADEPAYQCGRHEKNRRRSKGEIGIHSLRGGTVVGEHEVLFLGEDEVLSISHAAYSKRVFAVGALRAAAYLMGKPAGLYNMQHVIAEEDVSARLYTLDDQAVITLSPLPAKADAARTIFEAIAAAGVCVDMLSLPPTSGKTNVIGFSLDKAQLSVAQNALKSLIKRCPGVNIEAHSPVTKLSIEGSGMALKRGVAARLFAALDDAGIAIKLATSSETRIEVCVNSADAERAARQIHQHFLGDA